MLESALGSSILRSRPGIESADQQEAPSTDEQVPSVPSDARPAITPVEDFDLLGETQARTEFCGFGRLRVQGQDRRKDRGRRQAKHAQEEAHYQAEMQAAQSYAATEEELTNFKNAFSVCLEAKDYMVKF